MKNVELTENEQDTATQTSAAADSTTVSEQTSASKTSAAGETMEEKKKSKKTRKTKECRVDHTEKTITITKKASIPGTEAFKELAESHTLYPDYKIVYRTARTSESRAITNNLTVEKMKEYIDIFHPSDEARKNAFATMSRVSKLYPNPLSFMRKWFRSEYPQYWKYAEELNAKVANA